MTAPQRSLPSIHELFEQHRCRLQALIEFRMDRKVRARIDSSDVIQDAFAEAVRRYPAYATDQRMSPFVWLRFLTMQQLQLAHRRHLGVEARSARSEVSHDSFADDSGSIIEWLVGSESSPSFKAQRNELFERLTNALQEMEAADREILVLRHFEQMEFSEIAETVNLSIAAVASRHRRSLKKLGEIMGER